MSDITVLKKLGATFIITPIAILFEHSFFKKI